MGAWAQPGHGPRGESIRNAGDREPRVHREELRALIRQQPPARTEEEDAGVPRHPHQLSPEERRNLRNQLRQQRPQDWRHPP